VIRQEKEVQLSCRFSSSSPLFSQPSIRTRVPTHFPEAEIPFGTSEN
jgi:hypothetical protein